ncbi:MAG: immunoglobulin domain-containing protein [Opitutaceae bacterium]|nr:immunoglobulin domain-containing protein [Opitutaceae bacterium]
MDNAALAWFNRRMRLRFLAPLALGATLSAQVPPPPVFTTQPAPFAGFVGDALTLSAVAEGDAPITYQWHKNTLAIAGATGTALGFSTLELTDIGIYYVVATNAGGPTLSQSATVFVTKRAQTIAFAPTVTGAIAGSSLTLTATASSGLPVTLSLVSGSATLTGSRLTGDGGNVVVRATQAGNAFYSAADAVDRTFTFVAGGLGAFITSPPLDTTVNAGTAVALRVSAVGTPAPTFQWGKDGVAIAGATGNTYTVASATLADAGSYTVVVANPGATATASATVTVRAAPVITDAPASRTVNAGDSVSFTVALTGVPAPTYQWRRNGTAIAGATRDTLAIASATTANAGRYDVVVTNALGSATSEAATLTVTVRDFSGVYFGRFAGGTGNAALLVRPDRTGVFLGHLPATSSGLAVLDVSVDFTGRFSTATTTLGTASRAVTVRGTIDEAAGMLAGDVTGLNVAFDGVRAARTGPAAASAGLFSLALIGSAAGRGQAIVGADGQAMLLLLNNTALDSARGTLTAVGRLAVPTVAAQAALDVTFNGGLLAGSLRVGNATGPIAGAIEALTGAERLINLSVRSITQPGAASLLTGFVVSGTGSRQVLVRVAGPALAVAPFNLPGALADPALQLVRGTTNVATNNDWGTPAANAAAITAAAARSGAFPFRAGSADAALLTTLQPGAYSVAVGGGTGTVLTEIYEVLDATEIPGARRISNLSVRGLVAPTSPFIAGFVIGGHAPQRVLLRGIGPALSGAPFNVQGTLPNPDLTLYRGAAVVKTNDDWFRDPDAALIRAAATSAGAFALGASSTDAAMLIWLEPGAYTLQVGVPAGTPAAGTTGLALAEIYEAAP